LRLRGEEQTNPAGGDLAKEVRHTLSSLFDMGGLGAANVLFTAAPVAAPPRPAARDADRASGQRAARHQPARCGCRYNEDAVWLGDRVRVRVRVLL
jgi:hypothetical protein